MVRSMIAGSILAGLVFAAMPAHAVDSVRLSTEVYLIYQDAADTPVVAPAVETPTTASYLYKFCSASSHTGFEVGQTDTPIRATTSSAGAWSPRPTAPTTTPTACPSTARRAS